MKGTLIVIGICVTALVAFVYGIILIANVSEKARCNDMKKILGAETETYVSMHTGCIVKYEGKWMTPGALLSNTHEVTLK
jgi:hypothetical protein